LRGPKHSTIEVVAPKEEDDDLKFIEGRKSYFFKFKVFILSSLPSNAPDHNPRNCMRSTAHLIKVTISEFDSLSTAYRFIYCHNTKTKYNHLKYA